MSALTGKRILLIDDDDAQREVVEEVLLLEGATVFTAAGAEEGLPLLSGSPDAVLMDLHGVNVELFLDALRKSGSRAAVVLVSGDLRLAEHATRLQAHAHLGKPYEIEDLVNTVAEALSRSGCAGHPDAHA